MRFILSLLLLVSLAAKSQERPLVQVTLYNETNGGPSGLVNCIYQAKSGYLWFGCSNGLVRFDGYAFVLFQNEKGYPSAVTHIIEDKNGNLWMSFAEGGLATYSPANGHFVNYSLQNDKEPSLRTVQIMTLHFDKQQRLWLGTAQKGLVLFDAIALTTKLYPLNDKHHDFYAPAIRKIYNTVYAIAEDKAGALWLATHDGLYTLPNVTSLPVAVRPKPVQPDRFRTDLFNDLAFDGDTLWLSAWGGGMWRYQKSTGLWQNFLPNKKMVGKGLTNIINTIAEKSREEWWVSSDDNGLGIFNKRTGSFLFFRDYIHNADLPATEAYGMERDKDGNVWLIHDQRLVKLRLQQPKFYFTSVPVTHTDTQGNYAIADVWEDATLRLIATDYADGLHVLNKQTGASSILPIAHLPNEEPAMRLRQLYADSKDRIWVVSSDFLYWYDRRKNKLTKAVQPPLYSADSLSNNFSVVQEDKNGKIWIATRRCGVYVWDEQRNKFEHYFAEAESPYLLPFNYIRRLTADASNRMWIAGIEGVLGYVNLNEKTFTNLATTVEGIAKTAGVKSYSLFADKQGNVWAGTTTGLYCFNATGPAPALQKIITAADGLRTEPVYHITEDRAGNIWCLNDAGVCFLPQGGLPVTVYSSGDGINKGTGIRLLPTASDSLLLLNYGGYYRFVPQQLAKSRSQAPLVITAMQVNGAPFYFEEDLAKNKAIELGAGQNYFSFEFAALTYSHPEKQQYAYMLEGIDKGWIPSGSRRFVSYTNVPGGHYAFKVKTLEPDASGKERLLSLPLIVATPFYRTVLFFMLLAAVIAAVLYAVYRSRLAHHDQVYGLESKAQRLEKEKALVMYEGLKQQLNPHFLFNSLTSLNSLIAKDPQTARQFLESLSSTYRYILRSRESEVVELSKEVAFAETYTHLQRTRFGEALQINIRIDEEYQACKIVPVTLQNLIENATKHNVLDKDEPLHVDIYTDKDYIVVRNNLQRKRTVETSNKQGLRSMKTLYSYLTDRPMLIEETSDAFTVRIPLLP